MDPTTRNNIQDIQALKTWTMGYNLYDLDLTIEELLYDMVLEPDHLRQVINELHDALFHSPNRLITDIDNANRRVPLYVWLHENGAWGEEDDDQENVPPPGYGPRG